MWPVAQMQQKAKRACVCGRSDRWDPNLPRSAEWRLLSSQAAVPRHKTGRQQWAHPFLAGLRSPDVHHEMGYLMYLWAVFQNGKASVFASTKWANAKCPCNSIRVHWYQTHKGPFLFNPMQIKHCAFQILSYLILFPTQKQLQGVHLAKLWCWRYLWDLCLWGWLSNWSIYTMLGWGMKLTLTHLDHHSAKPTHPKGTGTRAEIR